LGILNGTEVGLKDLNIIGGKKKKEFSKLNLQIFTEQRLRLHAILGDCRYIDAGPHGGVR